MSKTIEDRLSQLREMPYEQYLQTPEWKERRDAALATAKHRCQLCNGEEKLAVHHRTYDRRGAELPSDLTVLCGDCHWTHHRGIHPKSILDAVRGLFKLVIASAAANCVAPDKVVPDIDLLAEQACRELFHAVAEAYGYGECADCQRPEED